jgi:RTX calcium-binding nonapeptide repeat (4 copies)
MVAPAKSGPEILVNTTTASGQDHPSVTALKNGKFVVVWHDFNQPGSGADTSFDAVRGQMFNADGSKMGAEFVLSGAAQTLGVQQDPTVITLNDGRFVAAWESFNHQSGDPSGSCIDARIYNSDGTPATGEFLVNTHTDFWQTRASMAPLDTGGFIVTWMHDFQGGNQNYDIFARLYGADGNPVRSTDFGVAVGAEIEAGPVVTGLPGNKYMIAWKDDGGPTLNDGSGSHIGAIVLTGNNHETLNGPQFIVNSTTVNDQSQPAIALLDNGNVVITFTHAFSATDDDLRGRVFNASGAALANDFSIDANTAREFDSSIVALPGAQYFVSWTDNGSATETDGSGSHIRGAIMSGTGGTNVSGDFIINSSTTGDQRESAVTVLADGRILAVWTDAGQSAGDTSGSAIRAQIFDQRTAAVNLTGTSDGDDWVGTSFNDTMSGGAGADRMDGAGGVDTASYASAPGAVIVNLATGQGSLGDAAGDVLLNIENLTGSAYADTLIGSTADNRLDGGGAVDLMIGGAGNDIYFVDHGGDVVVENPGEGSNDIVFSSAHFALSANVENLVLQGIADLQGYGNGLTNVIVGNAGNNLLDGGASADLMLGGFGDDTYFVDDAGDQVTESPGEGNDAVFSSAHFALSANVEILVLQGNADLQGYGNGLTNMLYGNGGKNLLNGNGGADVMLGGAGDDAYFVDDAGDQVIESASAGNDAVFSTAHFALSAEVETLVLQGTADLQGYGNGLSNTLYGNGGNNLLDGNGGNNLLDGSGGADVMSGGAGDDTYFVDDAGDLVFENANEGTDAVFSTVNYTLTANVETLVLQGSGDLNGTGNGLADKLFGNGGNNILDGGASADVLTGNAGNDTFVFNVGQAAGDTVVDFAGNGAAAGDSLKLVGYGAGATLTNIDATHWQVNYNGDALHELITFMNGASIDPTDVLFV